jgi:hypothetical protein
MEITRRDLIRVSATMTVLGIFGRTTSAMGDALPSWNDGPAKKAILASVKETTELSENTRMDLPAASRKLTSARSRMN